MKGFLLLMILILSACGNPRVTTTNHIIKEVLSCTSGTSGGFLHNGTPPRYRVSFEDGTRANVRAPVAKGDIMECVDNIISHGKYCYLK